MFDWESGGVMTELERALSTLRNTVRDAPAAARVAFVAELRGFSDENGTPLLAPSLAEDGGATLPVCCLCADALTQRGFAAGSGWAPPSEPNEQRCALCQSLPRFEAFVPPGYAPRSSARR